MQAAPVKSDRTSILPARIVEAIRTQQDVSERMVGWFQLAFVALFGLLYFMSPKTFSADQTCALVPWFLVIYLALTVIRLVLAYRNRMTAALLYLSVIIDMGLLLGMIRGKPTGFLNV